MIGLDLVTRVWRRLTLGDATPIDALLEPGFVAIDLETTGLNVRRDAVVAIAAIPFERGEFRAGFVTLVNPGRPTLDTRRLARAAGWRDSRLEVVAASFRIPLTGRHTAEGDARMAGEILLALLPALRRRGARTLGDLVRLQRGAPLHDG